MHPSPLLDKIVTLPWGFGVDVFFIISGFIMMYTAHDMFGRAGAFQSFMGRRLIRILPPYWFFTSVIVAIALLLPKVLDSTIFTTEHALLSYLFVPHLEPGEHATRLHPILGLGWTLVYEMFFYVMFALALFFRQSKGLLLLLAAFIGLFISAQHGVWSDALNIFWSNSVMLEFLLGVLVGLYARKGGMDGKAFYSLLGLALAGTLLGYLLPPLGDERLFKLGMPALVVFCLLYRLQVPRTKLWLGLVLIGDASYTLYLSHPFALTATKLAMTPLLKIGAYHPALVFAYLVAALGVATAGAIVFYGLCEKPVTGYLQKKLLRNHRSA